MSTSTAIIDIQVKGASSIKQVADSLEKSRKASMAAAGGFSKLTKSEKAYNTVALQTSKTLKLTAASLKAAGPAMAKMVVDAERAAKGYTKLRDRLHTTNLELKKSKLAVKNLSVALDQLGVKTKKASASQRTLSQDLAKGALASSGKIWMAYAGNLAAMSAGFIAASAAAKTFNNAIEFDYLTKYSVAISDTETSLNGLQESILSIKGVADGPIQLADGLKELVKAGKDTEEIFGTGMLESMSKFATVAEMDIGKAVQFSVAQMNAFGRSAEDVQNIIAGAAFSAPISFDDLNASMKHTVELASVAGVSLEDVATALTLVGQKGIKGSMAGTALRTAMEKLVTPSEKVQKVLRELDVDLNDAFGPDGQLDIKKAMQLYSDLYKKLDPISKIELTKDWFGLRAQKDVAALIGAFENGAAGWDEVASRIERAKQGIGLVDQAYSELTDTAKIAGAIFMATFETKAINATRDSLDAMVPALQGITKHADGIWDAFMYVGGTSIIVLLGKVAVGLWAAEAGATGLAASLGRAAISAGKIGLMGAALAGGYKLGEMMGSDPDADLSGSELFKKQTQQELDSLLAAQEATEKYLADKRGIKGTWKETAMNATFGPGTVDSQIAEGEQDLSYITDEVNRYKAVMQDIDRLAEQRASSASGELGTAEQLGSVKEDQLKVDKEIAAEAEKTRLINIKVLLETEEADARLRKLKGKSLTQEDQTAADAARNSNTNALNKEREILEQTTLSEAQRIAQLGKYAEALDNLTAAEIRNIIAKAENRVSAKTDSMLYSDQLKDLKGLEKLNATYLSSIESFQSSADYKLLTSEGETAELQRREQAIADITYSMDNLMQAGLEGDNFWDGFNAGLYNAQKDMKKLGELGSDVFTILRDGVKDSFVAIFNGEFDKIGEIWDATLNSMLDSVIDWAAEAAANMVIDATVGFVDDITGGFLSDLGIGNGPKGTPNDPMYVSVVGGAAALSELSADTGLSVSELGNILESSGTAVIDAERLNQSIDSALSTSVGTISSWYAGLTAEANGVNDGTVLSLIEGSYGPSATGETSDTQAVPDTSTSDVWQGYLGMAAGAYGMYSGYNQFDSGNYVGGAVSTAGGAANIYQGGTQAGLWGGEYAGSISSVTGLVGGLYGMYGGISDMLDNGVTAQNAIGTGASAYSTYAAGSTMLSEGGLLAGVGESLGVWSSDALGSIVVNELVVEGGAYAGAELGGAYVGAEVGSSAAGGMGTMGTLGAVGAVFMAIENGHLLAGMMSDRNEPTGKATAESGREYYTYGDQNIVEQIATDVSGYLATATMTDSTMSDNFGIEGEGFTLQQQQDAAEEAKNYVGVYASIADEFGVLGGVIEELGVTTADYNAIVGGTSEALTNSTEAMSGYVDLTTDQVNSLLTYTGDDLIGFASSIGVGFEQLTDVLNGVNGATTSASNSINSMNNDLYTTTLRDPFTGFANGGIVGYAAGGVLEGGSGVRDDLYLGTVNGRRQMAMGGEFIMPKSATQKYLPALQAMQTDSYADGGIVGGTSLDTIMEPIVDSWADYVVKMFDVWEQEVRLRDGGPSQYGAAVYNQDPYDRSASSEDLESIMAGFNDTIGEYTLTSYEDDVRKMNISYSDTIELMKEYGATAEELAKAQMTWELDRAELHKRAAETRSDFMTPYIEMANGATDAEKFMTDLADRYTEAGAAAVKLGASEDELAIIRAAAASEIDGQISSIMDSVEDVIDKDSLSDAEYAAKGINERYDDMRDSLITLRASAGELADLEEARRIELENARGSSALDYYDDLRAMGAQISTFGSQSTPQSLATEPAEQSISVNVLIEGNDIINDGELRSRIVDISDETASDKAEREYSDRVSYPTVR